MQISLLFILLNFWLIESIGLLYHTLKSVTRLTSHLEAKYNSKRNKIQYTIKSKMYSSRNTEREIIEMWRELGVVLSMTCASRNSLCSFSNPARSPSSLSKLSPFFSFLFLCLDLWSFPYTFTSSENSSILITSIVSASPSKGNRG